VFIRSSPVVGVLPNNSVKADAGPPLSLNTGHGRRRLPQNVSAHEQMVMASNASQSFLARCWGGSARLWQAYWLVGVAGYLFIMLLLELAGVLLWRGPQDNLWFNSAAFVVVVAYLVFSGVSIWRCSPNSSSAAWGALARTVLILSIVVGAIGVWRAL